METKIKKLNKLVLNNKAYNIMAAQQLKHITGGYGGGTCAFLENTGNVMCNLSYDEVQFLIAGGGMHHWCCDSCGSTSGWADVCFD